MFTGNDAIVRYLKNLPRTIRGVTVPNSDGTFSIYINGALSPHKQKEALEHELRHLQLSHLYDDAPIRQNEKEADNPENSGAAGRFDARGESEETFQPSAEGPSAPDAQNDPGFLLFARGLKTPDGRACCTSEQRIFRLLQSTIDAALGATGK